MIQYKKGDAILIRSDLVIGKRYKHLTWNSVMNEELLGKAVKVVADREEGRSVLVPAKNDVPGPWFVADEMIQRKVNRLEYALRSIFGRVAK